jgi:hypothetical protein
MSKSRQLFSAHLQHPVDFLLKVGELMVGSDSLESVKPSEQRRGAHLELIHTRALAVGPHVVVLDHVARGTLEVLELECNRALMHVLNKHFFDDWLREIVVALGARPVACCETLVAAQVERTDGVAVPGGAPRRAFQCRERVSDMFDSASVNVCASQ